MTLEQDAVHAGDPVGSPAQLTSTSRLLPQLGMHPALDRLSMLVVRLLDSESAQVSLLTDMQTVAGSAGLPTEMIDSRTTLTESICNATATCGRPLVVDDARADARVANLAPVASGLVGSYLGVPLTANDGQVVGALCAFNAGPRDWTDSDVLTLTQLADTAVSELELSALTRDYDTSRQRWDLVVEAAGIAILDWDVSRGELAPDDRLLTLFGLDPAAGFDDTGAALAARVHPADVAGIYQTYTDAILGDGKLGAEFRVLLPSGLTRWVQARGRILTGPDLQSIRVLGAAWDATRAREIQARADLVLETMSVGYVSMDGQWRLTYVNSEAERLLATARTELLGQVVWEVFPHTVGTDFEAIYRRVAATGHSETFEVYSARARQAWYEIRAVAGTSGGLSLYFLDITERHLAQEQAEVIALHDHAIATALQDAMFTRLPKPADIELAARYLTAVGQDKVGGDWYDAIVREDGTTVLMIGDVMGHDIAAAGSMGQLRTMLRAFAWEHDEPPSVTVNRLDAAMQHLDVATLATALVARVSTKQPDGSPRTLTWTSAGHVPPLLICPGVAPRYLDPASDLLLGYAPDAMRADNLEAVPAGATLLLFTDGLIESREHSFDEGLATLLGVVARHQHLSVEDLLDAVLSDITGPRPVDDVAILAARFVQL